MNKKVETLHQLDKAMISAYDSWHDYLVGLLLHFGALEIRDENEGNDLTDDYAKRINVDDANHCYVYSPTFDGIRGCVNEDGAYLEFHIKDGDGWAEDNTWINETYFAGLFEWLELTDWIVFPDE